MNRLMTLNGGRNDHDSAMYIMLPLEDMIEYEGGEMYDNLMLKPSNWKVMGNTSISGIVNSVASKHGIGKPFVDMRNAMMLGTIVVKEGKYIRIRSNYTPPIPVILAPEGMNNGTCSSALTKMTASMYQRKIDMFHNVG